MAKPTGPLLAFDARGSIAKTQVYSSWRGRSYVRRHVIPANPKSTSQMQTRNVFSWLAQVWKRAPTDFQDPWTAFAAGQPLTNRNALNKSNIGGLRTATDLANFVFSPGAKGGLAPVSITVTPGAGQLTVAVTAPALPSGWTIQEAVACCVRDQDPHSGTFYTITSGTDTTSPYSIVLSGLTASQLYRVGAWLKWTKPDATTAYSVAIDGSGTPT